VARIGHGARKCLRDFQGNLVSTPSQPAQDARVLGTDVLLRQCLGAEADLLFQSCNQSLRRMFEILPISPAHAQLHAVAELVRRASIEDLLRRRALDSPKAVRDFLAQHFLGYCEEHFGALWLDAQNRLIVFDDLFRGTLTQTSVYPREVVKMALKHNAAAVIFAHNHPSGVAEPSRADEMLTATLKRALALVDVGVLDHMVVAFGSTLSFAERGLL